MRTDYRRNTLVPRDDFLVVTFSPLEGLGKVYDRLRSLALEIELVNAALRDH